MSERANEREDELFELKWDDEKCEYYQVRYVRPETEK